LGAHLAVGAVDIITSLGRCGTLAGVVTFVDDGKVEEISTEREVKVVDGPSLE
jgi:hypothetical protein